VKLKYERLRVYRNTAKGLGDYRFHDPGRPINGPGSSIAGAGRLVIEIPKLLHKYGVSTMLDAACGDLTWMQHADLRFLHSYIGIDFNKEAIEKNRLRYNQRGNMVFMCANLLTRKRFPPVDLILCRDFLAHLPTEWIMVMLERFRASGALWLLASNYPGADNNFEYDPSQWTWEGYMERAYDLTKPPFLETRIDSIPERSAPKGVIAREHELALFALQH
jgi:hypothetical protein